MNSSFLQYRTDLHPIYHWMESIGWEVSRYGVSKKMSSPNISLFHVSFHMNIFVPLSILLLYIILYSSFIQTKWNNMSYTPPQMSA